MPTLDEELAALEAPAVICRACGHAYTVHEDGGGHCADRIGGWSSPAAGVPCMCPGFRWVAMPGEPGYDGPPSYAP